MLTVLPRLLWSLVGTLTSSCAFIKLESHKQRALKTIKIIWEWGRTSHLSISECGRGWAKGQQQRGVMSDVPETKSRRQKQSCQEKPGGSVDETINDTNIFFFSFWSSDNLIMKSGDDATADGVILGISWEWWFKEQWTRTKLRRRPLPLLEVTTTASVWNKAHS